MKIRIVVLLLTPVFFSCDFPATKDADSLFDIAVKDGLRAELPTVPTGLVVQTAEGQIMASWNAVSNADTYEVYYNNTATPTAALFRATSSTYIVITGLSNGTAYYVWVKAKNAKGSSEFSEMASGMPIAASNPPVTPGTPYVQSGDGEITVVWDAVPTATKYEVWIGTSQNSGEAHKWGNDTHDLSVRVTGLSKSTVYYLWIKAKNSAGSSGFSPMTTGKPLEDANAYTVNSVQTFKEAFQAINASSKDGAYIITISGEYVVNRVTLATNAKKKIVLRGAGSPCVLYNGGDDPLFTVHNRITLVLENNITLNGNQKYYPAVRVSLGGTLEMNAGAVITGAKAGGVKVAGGIFNMKEGTISNNGAGNDSSGGGVQVYNNGAFNLSGGIISDNTGDRDGGGIYVANATFTMTGGTISGNFGGDITDSYSSGGGGVMVEENGVFIMSDGTISSNTAQSSYGAYGGGVLIGELGSFTMSGGTITGNTVTAPSGGTYGGGVCVLNVLGGAFTKNGGGIIDNTNSAQTGKVACVYDGSFYGTTFVRNTTAGPSVNMNSAIASSAGGWE
jgi:hypothetical protein